MPFINIPIDIFKILSNAIIIPMEAHIITLKVFGKPDPPQWDPTYVRQIVGLTNAFYISAATGISFNLISIAEEDPVELPFGSSTLDDTAIADLTFRFRSKTGNVSLLLVKKLANARSGATAQGFRTPFVKFNSFANAASNVLSHELGHVLSLPDSFDVKDTQNLMTGGVISSQPTLKPEQIEQARQSPIARQFRFLPQTIP